MPISLPMRRECVEREVGFVVDDLQLHADQSLDRSKVIELVVITERHGNTGSAGSSRAPDTVNISLWNIGHIEVDNVCDLVHIDSARGDIGCNEHRHPT